jgi:hypothetical protein
MANEYLEDYVEFEDSKGLSDTQMAVHVKCAEVAKSFWVPKSIIHDDSEVYKAFTEGRLIISKWWAEKRGLV